MTLGSGLYQLISLKPTKTYLISFIFLPNLFIRFWNYWQFSRWLNAKNLSTKEFISKNNLKGCIDVKFHIFSYRFVSSEQELTLLPKIKWAGGRQFLIWSCCFFRQTNCSDLCLSPVFHGCLLPALINGSFLTAATLIVPWNTRGRGEMVVSK